MHWERLDEPIKVRADFRAGEVTPLLFRRGQRALRIVSVNSRWMDREGKRCVHYFSVSADSGDVYQLRFDTGDLTWRAEAIMYEG